MDADAAWAALSSTTAGWTKSSFSGGQNGCVETNRVVPGWVGVRDSKLGKESPLLVLGTTAAAALLSVLQTGQ
ncbi:DUF397 domain-containing protein [Amycolatopsis sp. NPDC058986]|uniref:DUF397 domain-containing protein n=1 Tax=unclassified Amycolatopsis TaxID=2618356 RepID=UPI00366BC41F